MFYQRLDWQLGLAMHTAGLRARSDNGCTYETPSKSRGTIIEQLLGIRKVEMTRQIRIRPRHGRSRVRIREIERV
jgi:hypothetical protein